MIKCWLGGPSGATNIGFGLLWPRPVWPVWTGLGVTASCLNRPVWPVWGTGRHWQLQRLDFRSGVFIPLSPLLRGLLVLWLLLSFLKHFLDQLALPSVGWSRIRYFENEREIIKPERITAIQKATCGFLFDEVINAKREFYAYHPICLGQFDPESKDDEA